MGEVYRARDTRLGRDVAVKVLPQHLSSNPEVRARFEREAKTVSSLNHPHICTLFDVGREGSTDYLVMELIEGETLATRLARGALPAADLVKTGVQIADALSRAHRAGVVHRDLKPGNVMLTKSGAKLMDFGLARATGLAGASASGATALTQSPTVAQPLTAEGTIVGTFQYMSPEQLEGKEADARSDVWALGCVLYEMATGRRAFEGRSQASLISSIMKEEPRALAEVAPMSPPALDRLVRLCLAKDPDDRIQTAHDVKLRLEGMTTLATSSGVAHVPAVTPARDRGRRERIAWAVAAVALVVAAALAWNGSRPAPPVENTSDLLRFTVTAPPGARLADSNDSFAISPDGRTLAFVASDSSGTPVLWVRELGDPDARRLDGTADVTAAFWSPDSRTLAFFSGGKLRKVSLRGGGSEAICDAPDHRGGAWGPDGHILFAPHATGGLYRVSADGGTPVEVFRPDSARGETGFRYPVFLPGGTHAMFLSLPRQQSNLDIHLGDLATGKRELLMRAGAVPVYSNGYLVTERNLRLVAQRFDLASRKLVGEPVDLREAPTLVGNYGVPALTASDNGLLAYSAARPADTGVFWYDRSGRRGAALPLPAGRWITVSISPDGTRALAGRVSSSTDIELWLVDLERGASRRFAPEVVLLQPQWSPDGTRVVYQKNNHGPEDMFVRAVDSASDEPILVSDALFKNHAQWTPDGVYITYAQPVAGTGWDVWRVRVDGDRTPEPLVRTAVNERGGWVSPDQRWLAFVSDETGREELHVQSYPSGGNRRQLTTNGVGGSVGLSAMSWSPDGLELIFHDGEAWVIDIEPGALPRPGVQRRLIPRAAGVIGFAVSRDHQRFLACEPLTSPEPAAIGIDVNWSRALPKETP
jgi:Tol biopolymer transport system component